MAKTEAAAHAGPPHCQTVAKTAAATAMATFRSHEALSAVPSLIAAAGCTKRTASRLSLSDSPSCRSDCLPGAWHLPATQDPAETSGL